jgi:hypothetical protein
LLASEIRQLAFGREREPVSLRQRCQLSRTSGSGFGATPGARALAHLAEMLASQPISELSIIASSLIE